MANDNDRPKTNTAKKTKNIRQLKVGRSCYPAFKRETYPRARIVPWIQMKGHWLAKAGFTVDSLVQIQVKSGRLVLTSA